MNNQNQMLYEELAVGHIRLVELLPGDGGHILTKLHTFPLAEAPPFEALSYASGYQAATREIICNGLAISIRANLFAFLQSIRQYPHVPLLWIDSLCINYENLREMQQMIEYSLIIYRTATRTQCWTGLEYHSSLRELMITTRQVGDHEEAIAECLLATDILHSAYKVRQSDLEVFQAATAMIDTNTRRSVDAFLNQLYFNRVWTMQDIVCSQNPVIFDGGDGIPWGQLSQALLPWLIFNPNLVLQSPAIMSVLLCESMRRKYHGLCEASITWPDILLALRSCEVRATHPRDYVYAAYSIGKGLYPEGYLHEVDYTPTSSELYARASLDLNKSSGQPLSLSLVDDFLSHLPSWAVDWGTRSRRLLLNYPTSSFSASKYTDPERSSVDSDHALRRKFICTGLVVDIVRDTNEYMPPRRHCDHYTVSGDNSFFFTEWFEFAKEKSDKTRADEEVLLDYADTIQARGCNHIWEQPVLSTHDRLREIRDFLDFLENPDAEEKNSTRLFYAACYPSHDRRFAITRNKHFCLVPEATRRGDLVCIPHGSRVPYIFRLREDDSGDLWYQNIGETYVHDMMHGEGSNTEGLVEQDFCLR